MNIPGRPAREDIEQEAKRLSELESLEKKIPLGSDAGPGLIEDLAYLASERGDDAKMERIRTMHYSGWAKEDFESLITLIRRGK